MILLWLTQAPAEESATPRYFILAVIVVLYLVYRLLVRRSKPLKSKRPKY